MEYEKGNLNDLFDKLKKAYIREVVDGYPIHIIKSNLVSIHHQFLEEIFQDDYFREKKYFAHKPELFHCFILTSPHGKFKLLAT